MCIKFKKNNILNYSFLGMDIHNHILPGLDDGALDLLETGKIISELKKLGFTGTFTTPHIKEDLYQNTTDIVTNKLNYSISNLSLDNTKFIKGTAAEYFLDNGFKKLRLKKDLLAIDNKYVLIEMGFLEISPILENEIFQLQLNGLTPILAHVERYLYLSNDISYCIQLLNMGCHFQLNLLSLVGYYGKKVQKFALELLKMELYQWAGTDLHNINQIGMLVELKDHNVFKKLVQYPFMNSSLLINDN